MTRQDVARIIVRSLANNGLMPDEYLSLDVLVDELLDRGLELDALERGLVAALEKGWVQTSGTYVGLTALGQSTLAAANDNGAVHLVT